MILVIDHNKDPHNGKYRLFEDPQEVVDTLNEEGWKKHSVFGPFTLHDVSTVGMRSTLKNGSIDFEVLVIEPKTKQ